MTSPGILFYGDPHGHFEPLVDSVLDQRPEAVVIVGDLGLDEPLFKKLAVIWDLVPGGWHWIVGNHDVEAEHFPYLLHMENDLGGTMSRLGGHRVAGLGGIFKSSIWYPKGGAEGEPATFDSPAEKIRSTARADRWGGGLPLSHRDTIFPSDYQAVARLRCDVLVCHEAPTSHRHGFGAVDDLALATGARLVVHGHHHDSYAGHTRDGVPVRGLGRAETWLWDGKVDW